MSTSTQRRPAASSGQKAFTHKDGTGTLFYDAPGVPTLSGSFSYNGTHNVTAEPAVDKNSRDYVRITGENVSGALYVNDRKESERHPDHTGPIEVDGVKLRIVAWTKQTKTGKNAGQDYLSLAVSEPQQRPQEG